MSGWGNLGAGPKPPQWGSKRRARASRARVSRAGAVGQGGVGGRGGQVGHPAEGRREPVGLLADLGPLVPPPLVDRPQDLLEGGHAVAGLVRVVGAAVEGAAVGGEEDGHGPAAVAGHGLHRLHVDGVDVGPLLPVDLDVDEQLVHEGGGGRRPRTTRGPSRGTSGRRRSRWRAGRACPRPGPARRPRRPTGTSRRGCPCAAGGRGSTRRPIGSWSDESYVGSTLQTGRVQIALDVLLVVAVGGMLWSAVARIRRGRVVVPRCPSCGRTVVAGQPPLPALRRRTVLSGGRRAGRDDAAFRAEARAWLAEHARPVPGRPGGPSLVFADVSDTEHVVRGRAWQRELSDGGWAGLGWPVEHGGRGLPVAQRVIWAQEAAAAGRPAGDQPGGRGHGRADAHGPRHRGAAAPVPAADPARPTRSGASCSASPTPAPTWPR